MRILWLLVLVMLMACKSIRQQQSRESKTQVVNIPMTGGFSLKGVKSGNKVHIEKLSLGQAQPVIHNIKSLKVAIKSKQDKNYYPLIVIDDGHSGNSYKWTLEQEEQEEQGSNKKLIGTSLKNQFFIWGLKDFRQRSPATLTVQACSVNSLCSAPKTITIMLGTINDQALDVALVTQQKAKEAIRQQAVKLYHKWTSNPAYKPQAIKELITMGPEILGQVVLSDITNDLYSEHHSQSSSSSKLALAASMDEIKDTICYSKKDYKAESKDNQCKIDQVTGSRTQQVTGVALFRWDKDVLCDGLLCVFPGCATKLKIDQFLLNHALGHCVSRTKQILYGSAGLVLAGVGLIAAEVAMSKIRNKTRAESLMRGGVMVLGIAAFAGGIYYSLKAAGIVGLASKSKGPGQSYKSDLHKFIADLKGSAVTKNFKKTSLHLSSMLHTSE